jgi:hypothetical protein
MLHKFFFRIIGHLVQSFKPSLVPALARAGINSNGITVNVCSFSVSDRASFAQQKRYINTHSDLDALDGVEN